MSLTASLNFFVASAEPVPSVRTGDVEYTAYSRPGTSIFAEPLMSWAGLRNQQVEISGFETDYIQLLFYVPISQFTLYFNVATYNPLNALCGGSGAPGPVQPIMDSISIVSVSDKTRDAHLVLPQPQGPLLPGWAVSSNMGQPTLAYSDQTGTINGLGAVTITTSSPVHSVVILPGVCFMGLQGVAVQSGAGPTGRPTAWSPAGLPVAPAHNPGLPPVHKPTLPPVHKPGDPCQSLYSGHGGTLRWCPT